ncbi:MAG: DUF4276 family protein [Ignavibacteriaceae bacterium]|nr:DUF4276 family protein [Ignavibacteriaceae bacterium]
MDINIVVEGHSEEKFVKSVLVPHFALNGKYLYARRILTGFDAEKPVKGGLLKYQKLKSDIQKWIRGKENRTDMYFSTFVDLYAFPKDDESPYTKEIQGIQDSYIKIEKLEKAIYEDIGIKNFLPYVQLHEFESFIFADLNKLGDLYFENRTAVKALERETKSKPPELINETTEGAPSKRIIKHIPKYAGEKAHSGPLIAEDIGISTLRAKCRHFNDWITRLEEL